MTPSRGPAAPPFTVLDRETPVQTGTGSDDTTCGAAEVGNKPLQNNNSSCRGDYSKHLKETVLGDFLCEAIRGPLS
jgi:hypothetical protein